MEIKLAETAGFCFGVKRAINMVENESGKAAGKPVFTYGPVIHNSDVINELAEKGVFSVDSVDEAKEGSTLVIRAHGVSEKVIKEAEAKGLKIVDATCPFVKKIHKIVREKSKEGHFIIVIGDKEHPEVQGICGWIGGDDLTVISSKEEAEALPDFENREVTVVFQTTFDTDFYKEYVEIISKKGYHINVVNTICNATFDRQKEAALIAKSVEVMLVVGDKKSANTNRLYDICRSHCKDTYFIQSLKDLDNTNLQSGISVGITAGASTPENIIQEVLLHVRGKEF